MPLLVHVGSEGQQKTRNFHPQSCELRGSSPWRAGEQMGVEVKVSREPQVWGRGIFFDRRPIGLKDPLNDL